MSTFASKQLFVAVVNQNIFDVPKTARQMLIDRMDDLVVVLDTQNHIVEINPAAQRGLGAPYLTDWPGTPVDESANSCRSTTASQAGRGGERGAVTVLQGTGFARSSTHVARLFLAQETWLGYLIVLRDVTAQKTIETALADRDVAIAPCSGRPVTSSSLQIWTAP